MAASPSSSGGNVLDTLASIKTQVSSVLHHLQQAKVSATVSAMSSPNEAATPPPASPQSSSVTPMNDVDSTMSRDDVKAQREAKKAAKAQRKSKSLGQATPEASSTPPNKMTIPPPASPQPLKTPLEDGVDSPVSRDGVKAQKEAKKAPKALRKSESLGQATPEASSTPPNKIKMTIPPPTTTCSPSEATTPAPHQSPLTKLEREKRKADLFEAEVEKVHPTFRELGLKFQKHVIYGSNQRTTALLETIKTFISVYKTPEGKGFKQELSIQLQYYFEKLKLYRPFAVGMTTSVDGINGAIRGLEEGLSESEYKEELTDWCDRFTEEKIVKAVEAIAQKGCDKIKNGDTILAFSLTDVIFSTFKCAGEMGKQFNLILAITKSENYLREYMQLKECMGSETFRKQVNVSCINISSIMSFIPSVTKVFLGGHALFTTGGVMSHAGSSTIALCANHHNVPVIFFCETYKFCDKSPTDAFYSDVFPENKFGFSADSDEEIDEAEAQLPTVAHIRYDVTPVNLVTCVITDIDMLPSSSVPVVLRVQENRPLTKCS